MEDQSMAHCKAECWDNVLKRTFEFSATLEATTTALAEFWQNARNAKNDWAAAKKKEEKMESKLSSLMGQ
jgi:hypothetical protein